MDEAYIQMMTEMGVSLAELAAKGTASVINKRVRALKDIKDVEKIRTTYDGLINEVLQEREEAVRIAQAYKTELDRIVISDEDIEHLYMTVSRVLELFKAMKIASTIGAGEADTKKVEAEIQAYEQVKELINVDTLKTMQLLGFNYKAAIGEPLTKLCADAITTLGTKNKQSNTTVKQQKK